MFSTNTWVRSARQTSAPSVVVRGASSSRPPRVSALPAIGRGRSYHVPRKLASMGPRSIERGNSMRLDKDFQGWLLQWGRARSNAEIFHKKSSKSLQSISFNGAALIRTRKELAANLSVIKELRTTLRAVWSLAVDRN